MPVNGQPTAVLTDAAGNALASGTGVVIVGGSFTRPGDTTAYASGDLVANSVTAGSVVAIPLSAGSRNGGTGMIRRVRLTKSGTSLTNASFRVHFYKTDPALATGISNGDNGAWLTKDSTWLGAVDITVATAFSDAAKGVGVPNNGTEINYDCAATASTIYALIEARAGYTPGNAEVFTLAVEIWQN